MITLLRWLADIAQVVERRIGSAEVTGPSPVISFFEASCRQDASLYFIGGWYEICSTEGT